MIVSICKFDLFLLDEPDNLKSKRQVLRHLKERLKSHFNAAVAEVDFQDKWQRTVIGISFISLYESDAEKICEKLMNFIERDGRLEIFDKYIDHVFV